MAKSIKVFYFFENDFYFGQWKKDNFEWYEPDSMKDMHREITKRVPNEPGIFISYTENADATLMFVGSASKKEVFKKASRLMKKPAFSSIMLNIYNIFSKDGYYEFSEDFSLTKNARKYILKNLFSY